ncbi:MAG: hypothetical protein HY816_08700 [Candidatus Wallbacteria bacterium]|nr:hypothetical protein [Candidatus Wallbacteria bacterium]
MAEIPKRYLLPIWYTGKVETRAAGGKIEVQARLQTNLATMRKARVWLEAGKGARLVSSSVAAVTPSVGGPRATASATGQFEGDLPPGSKLDVSGVLTPEPGSDHAYVTLAFDYDFPDEELRAHITARASEEYPDRELRELLIRTLHEKHRGRKSGGITERIELTSGSGR